ncbi:MAG: OmpA family protein [Deltaproteobacteria bacterium]|nr:OmpA family protein [Deltaproteobacteria bacterium]
MRSSTISAALAFTVLLCGDTTARAQTGRDTDTDLQDFLPMAGPADFLTIPSPAVSPHRSVGFGLVLNYVRKPLVLESMTDGAETDAVGYQVTADFLWAFGLWDQLQLGLALPVVVAQSGDGVRPIACADLDDCEIPELASTAIRDIRLDAKLRLGKRGPASAMAFAVSTSLPSGDEENFAGQRSAAVSPMFLLGGLTLPRRGQVAIALGARLRPRTEVADAKFGSELFARVGIGFEVVPRLNVTAEYFGNLPLADGADERQELLGGLRYFADQARDVALELGAGGGLSRTPGSPGLRAIAAVRYAPLGRDADEDGVADRTDACIGQPEDTDGFEDSDGCPDPDNDGDDVPDDEDGCDDAVEDRDGFLDGDGCPDPDNDGDSVPDGDDRCGDAAEDRDGFEDDDGCPDPDNDGDGVPDASDRCADEAEDRDGWQEEDGCPEADNDGDSIPDGFDQCPDEAEDRDGWQDEDGCPDPDDDGDGVPDASDRCVRDPETINGRADDDGCPDAGAESALIEEGVLVLRRALRFAPGASTLPARSEALVEQVAQLLRGRTRARFSILGFPDRPVDDQAQRDLALARAEALRAAFGRHGIGADRIELGVGAPGAGRRPGAAQFEVRVLARVAPAPAGQPTPEAPGGATAP